MNSQQWQLFKWTTAMDLLTVLVTFVISPMLMLYFYTKNCGGAEMDVTSRNVKSEFFHVF